MATARSRGSDGHGVVFGTSKNGIMRASELRIGNLVYCDGCVTVWDEGSFELITYIGIPDYYNPIPLTEEWLFKFGLKDEGDGYFSKWNGDYDYSISLIDGFSYGQCADYSHPIKLKYVHQLQNLYFALTGEELTIKEL